MTKILFATNNPHKIVEVKDLLADLGFEVLTIKDLDQPPDVSETGKTFLENAQLKAHQLADFSGLVTIADDSGLMVDKLNGQPGVKSARYASDHNDAGNNAKLLAELGGVVPEERGAIFQTTMVASFPGKFEQDLVVNGIATGQILAVGRGEDGFGYDPLFYLPEFGKTFAQMSTSEKNQVSHRGQAIRQLVAQFPEWYQRMMKNE